MAQFMFNDVERCASRAGRMLLLGLYVNATARVAAVSSNMLNP